MDRLLVIDDEAELGRFVGRVGESVGYEVKVTTRLDDFKDHVVQWKPTVILLDLAMPEADGLEVLRWLAAENCRSRIGIMSGFDSRVVESAKRIGQERGLNICFSFNKPVRVHDLKSMLDSLKQVDEKSPDEADLERAITERELFLQYQPKVALQTGMIVGAEALVRWRRGVHIVMPDQFIPLAESSGLIRELGRFVMAEAIHQQAMWARQGLDIEMAINLSPLDLRDERLFDHITAICQTENVPTGRIILEVTESTAMSNALEALDILTRLRLKGFKLSIDDFGTGFSSLTRLQRLPVTEIKIDRSFVGEMLTSPDALIIVKTIIALGHNMGMGITAEGVETNAHYEFLAGLGCEIGQGFGIGRPMGAMDLMEWYTQKITATGTKT